MLFLVVFLWKILWCLVIFVGIFLFIVWCSRLVLFSEQLLMICVICIICFWYIMMLQVFFRIVLVCGLGQMIFFWLCLCVLNEGIRFIGLGWYSDISVIRFLKWLGCVFFSRWCMFEDLNWNIVLVLLLVKMFLQVGVLLSGIVVMLIGGMFVCLWCLLIVFIVQLMMVSVCRLRKLNLIRLIFFMLFLLNWVIGFLLRLFLLCLVYSGQNLFNGLGLIIMLLVCLLVLWVRFFSCSVRLIRLWILFLVLQCWISLVEVIFELGFFLFLFSVFFRWMFRMLGISLEILLIRLYGNLSMWLELCIIVLVVMVLQVMIWLMCLCLYLCVMQLIILLWWFMQKLMLKLGIDMCFGFRNCLNSRLYGSGFRLVIFSVYVISELVFESWLGLIGMFWFLFYWMKLVMIRKQLGKFILMMVLSLNFRCLKYFLWVLFGVSGFFFRCFFRLVCDIFWIQVFRVLLLGIGQLGRKQVFSCILMLQCLVSVSVLLIVLGMLVNSVYIFLVDFRYCWLLYLCGCLGLFSMWLVEMYMCVLCVLKFDGDRKCMLLLVIIGRLCWLVVISVNWLKVFLFLWLVWVSFRCRLLLNMCCQLVSCCLVSLCLLFSVRCLVRFCWLVSVNRLVLLVFSQFGWMVMLFFG